jgi:hypothetical protein
MPSGVTSLRPLAVPAITRIIYDTTLPNSPKELHKKKKAYFNLLLYFTEYFLNVKECIQIFSQFLHLCHPKIVTHKGFESAHSIIKLKVTIKPGF